MRNVFLFELCDLPGSGAYLVYVCIFHSTVMTITPYNITMKTQKAKKKSVNDGEA